MNLIGNEVKTRKEQEGYISHGIFIHNHSKLILNNSYNL